MNQEDVIYIFKTVLEMFYHFAVMNSLNPS